jgi:hypothetical protein
MENFRMTAFRNFPQNLHIIGLHINGIQLYVIKKSFFMFFSAIFDFCVYHFLLKKIAFRILRFTFAFASLSHSKFAKPSHSHRIRILRSRRIRI